jgi:hypothetical protein
MEVTSGPVAAKRTRQGQIKETPSAPEIKLKKSRPRKKPAASGTEAPSEVFMEPRGASPGSDAIAVAAYFLAAERNFEPGRELDDWLEAERRTRIR